MKRWWANWWANSFGDTLFLRLFVLMWVALVASHLLAYAAVVAWNDRPAGVRAMPMPPVTPALPPMWRPGGPDGPYGPGGFGRPDVLDAPDAPDAPRGPPGPGAFPGLSPGSLWLDYLVRFVAIGVAAWFGARWLSAPMRRLAEASDALGAALGTGRPAPTLDETRGTLEVRQTAQVFNAMSDRLRAQFDAQSLLMAAISHDLRTPLARLRMRLETMDEQAQTQRCVADVREMDALIGSVLETMRDSHARTEPARIDAVALVQALVDDRAEQGLPVALLGTPAPAVVLAQGTALKRVLGNLIGNALQHGGATEVAVTRDAHTLRIVIADSGPGIAADRLDAVFEPFYRLDAAHARASGGSGLGLYIARDLARRHDGTLTLSNRVEGGLVATLTWPLA